HGCGKLCDGGWCNNAARQKAGIAVFPDELPRRFIRMFTYEGDTVLDPFLGSGTTTKVATKMRRKSIGYEIGFRSPLMEEDWTELIKRKIGYYDLSPETRDSVFLIETKEASPRTVHSIA